VRPASGWSTNGRPLRGGFPGPADCGTLPVVSSGVGCAADLVAGTGEIYPTGDTAALAAALSRALARLGDPGLAKRLQERIELYGVEQTALGFEQATDAAWRG